MAYQPIPEIELGSRICKSIKELYYADKQWVDAKQHIADLFTRLKVGARKMYPDCTEIQILSTLEKYDKFDMDILL